MRSSEVLRVKGSRLGRLQCSCRHIPASLEADHLTEQQEADLLAEFQWLCVLTFHEYREYDHVVAMSDEPLSAVIVRPRTRGLPSSDRPVSVIAGVRFAGEARLNCSSNCCENWHSTVNIADIPQTEAKKKLAEHFNTVVTKTGGRRSSPPPVRLVVNPLV